MLDSFELFAVGMFVGRDKEICPLRAPHAHGIVLTALTAANSTQSFAFNTAAFLVGRCKDRLFNYFKISFQLTVFNKSGTGNYFVGARLIQTCTGAFYKNIVAVFYAIFKKLCVFKLFGVSLQAEQSAFALNQSSAAVNAGLLKVSFVVA